MTNKKAKEAAFWCVGNNKEKKKIYNSNYSITHREEATIKQREYRRRKKLLG